MTSLLRQLVYRYFKPVSSRTNEVFSVSATNMAVFVANPGLQGGVSYVLGQKRSRPWVDGADRGWMVPTGSGPTRVGGGVKKVIPSKKAKNAGTPRIRIRGFLHNRPKMTGCLRQQPARDRSGYRFSFLTLSRNALTCCLYSSGWLWKELA